jgi:O-antigen ligase
MLFIVLTVYLALFYVRFFEWDISQGQYPVFFYVGVVSVVLVIVNMFSNTSRKFLKTDMMMFSLLISIVMSHVTNMYFEGAYRSLLMFLPSIVCYFLVLFSINSQIKAQYLSLVLIILTCFLAFEAIQQSLYGTNIAGIGALVMSSITPDGEIDYVYRARWIGSFSDPNDLGLALVLPIPLLMYNIIFRKYIVTWLCLPVLLYALYLTGSRGSFLALIASLVSFVILKSRSKKGVMIGLFLAALLLLIGPSRMDTYTDESSRGRVEAWYSALQMFYSHPFFGVGYGNFTEHNELTAHNSFFLVLAELGIVGFTFFCGLFFFPLMWVKKNIFQKSNSTENEESRIFVVSVVSSLLGVLTSMMFLSRSYNALVYLEISYLVSVIRLHCDNYDQHSACGLFEDYKLKHLLLAVIITIALMYALVKLLKSTGY